MIQSAFNTNLPGTVIGGVPAMGFNGAPFVGGVVDIDPISPGIQTQPGILTATGPSRIVGPMGGGMIASGYQGTGFGGMGFGAGGVVDADPITPGIQSQPGVVTPTGPPRVVSGPGAIGGGMLGSGFMASGYRGVGATGINAVNTTFAGGVGVGAFDADPITPGVQGQPGVVTPTGPSRVISGPGAVGGVLSGALAGGVMATGVGRSGFGDVDPITPGYQTTPGIVSATGPTRVVSGGFAANAPYGSAVYASGVGLPVYRSYTCCPWWLWTILGLLLLSGLIAGLYSLNGHKHEKHGKKLRTFRKTTVEEIDDTNINSKDKDSEN